MDLNGLKYLIVGSGFFGAVMAERIATVLNERVLILEKRDHIGGNSYSEPDPETNAEVHRYGSHIFHTSNREVWEYVNRFATFNNYRHRVMTLHKGDVYSMPINLQTINQFFRKHFNPVEAEAFIREQIGNEKFENPNNLEEKAISLIGRPLYEAFIKGYTQKQWATPLTELPSNIITRLPVRFNYTDFYFNDTYEGLPVEGYGALFRKLISHPNIDVKLGVDYFEMRDQIPKDTFVIYTGPIDRFFDYKFGVLGWRTTDFEIERHNIGDFQGCSVMNYADLDVPFTRIHEFKHYHPERTHTAGKTIIFKEYSRTAEKADTPYYPINTDRDKEMLKLYKQEANLLKNTMIGGRLGNYVYVDMHQAIAMALNAFSSMQAGRV